MGSVDMAVDPSSVDTPRSRFDAIDKPILEAESVGDGPFYWWRTSGQDLSRMLVEAGYPEECRRQFLDFYRDTICPALGGRPEPSSRPTAAGWDGNPFEYSFEFKGSNKKAGVRFILDLTELRPARTEKPIDTTTVERVLDVLRKRSPMYDETWVLSPLSLRFLYLTRRYTTDSGVYTIAPCL
jgi:DMATS type aromatic prenyltransferase